jgi:uncharacterized protein (TIGR03083 family)
MTVTAAGLDITPIGRKESFALAQVAVARELDLLRALTPEEWDRPTACPAWTVRQVVIHQSACAAGFLSNVEGVRQALAARRLAKAEGCEFWDAFMQAGARARDDWSPERTVEEFEDTATRFARRRLRFPAPVRNLVRMPGPLGTVTMGYLYDRVINRDLFMHRLDICDATGREFVVTADHDGRLVEDAVLDWAQAHGKPFDLTLTGPAGGHWVVGTDGERLELDALQFMRLASGRGEASGLLATPVLF